MSHSAGGDGSFTSPPRRANAFLEWYCADEFLEEVQGDLQELYSSRLQQSGTTRSNWWYYWDVLRFFRPYLLKRKLLTQNLGGSLMFRNYLKIAFRNLLKHKGYSFINIAGLVAGLTACILILLYVQDELSYDQFHQKATRIYRVNSLELREGRFWHLANNYGPAAPALLNDFSDIEQAVRLFPYSVVVERDQNRRFQEDRFMFTDSTFFEVFSFDLKQGDVRSVLRAPDEILITETMARKYFGSEDPMGKTLTVENQYDFKVSGVLQDLPTNSHFHFDFLAPISSVRNLFRFSITNWHWPPMYTYIVLPPRYPLERMEQQFPDFVAKNIGSWAPPKRRLALQPLTDIRLYSNLEAELEPTSSVAYIYILVTIAF
ncbi:ABC transporter permease, partial [bacterium]|nr:ABC transporter permease [bacterium]